MCVFLEPWGFLLSSVGSRPLCVISPEVALGRLAVVPGSSDSASLRGSHTLGAGEGPLGLSRSQGTRTPFS